MRKLFFIIPLMLLAFTGPALAGDLSSPAQTLKSGQFSLGVTGAWQSEQKFQDSDLRTTTLYSDGFYEAANHRIADFKIKDDQFYLATLSYGLSDWLTIHARAGLAAGGKEHYSVLNPSGWSSVEVKLKDAFTWGVGAKGKLFETPGGLGATVSIQYLRYDNRKEDNLVVNGQALALSTFDYQADYQQLDMLAALYQKLGAFTPYVGMGYNWAQFKYSGTSSEVGDYTGASDFSATNQDHLAVLLGLDVMLGERFTLNLQGSFVSQTALGLGLSYQF